MAKQPCMALIEEQNPTWEDRGIELGFEPVQAHPASLQTGRAT